MLKKAEVFHSKLRHKSKEITPSDPISGRNVKQTCFNSNVKAGKAQPLLITLTMALLYSRVPTLSLHVQYQDVQNEAAKLD